MKKAKRHRPNPTILQNGIAVRYARAKGHTVEINTDDPDVTLLRCTVCLLGGAVTDKARRGVIFNRKCPALRLGPMRNPGLPTLDEFIAFGQSRDLPSNSYVRETGFKVLYVRYNPVFYVRGGHQLQNVLTIASVEARKQHGGTFRSLISYLRSTYPDLSVYVENVLDPAFGQALERMGFEAVTDEEPRCFLLRAGARRNPGLCPKCGWLSSPIGLVNIEGTYMKAPVSEPTESGACPDCGFDLRGAKGDYVRSGLSPAIAPRSKFEVPRQQDIVVAAVQDFVVQDSYLRLESR